jgi:two-component system, OmpR family, response regulator
MVTAPPRRPGELRAHGFRRTHTRRPTPATGADSPALTVAFEVTLEGETRYSDAVEVLDTLRRVTDRLGSARVDVTPAPASHDGAPAAVASGSAVVIHADSRTVHAGGESVALTRVEFDLLLFLAQRPRRVFSRAQLLQSVWGYAHAGQRTVDVHIRRLRAKLGGVPLVTTIRGVGYRLADDADLRVVDSEAVQAG